jgi:hypothetical protein
MKTFPRGFGCSSMPIIGSLLYKKKRRKKGKKERIKKKRHWRVEIWSNPKPLLLVLYETG